MPKPILPKKLSPAMRAGTAAAGILDAKAEEVAKYAKPAMEGEVDGVHDMRVAVKRLREATRIFRGLMPNRRRKRVLPLVEELNDALGRVRELDVLMADAAALAEHAPAAQGLLQELRGKWADDRDSQHEALVEVWRRLRRSERILARMRRLARKTKTRDRPLNDMDLDEFGYAAITARTHAMRRRLTEALETQDPAALHRLRISVKRLKYTMEPFLPIFPTLPAPCETTANVQEALGLTHDFDVLEAALTDYLNQTGSTDSEPAQEALRVVGQQRSEVYAAARERIEDLAQDEWQHQLLDSID